MSAPACVALPGVNGRGQNGLHCVSRVLPSSRLGTARQWCGQLWGGAWGTNTYCDSLCVTHHSDSPLRVLSPPGNCVD